MIPIRDANPTRRTPWVTLAFITVNVAVFLSWQPTFGGEGDQAGFFYCNAEIPWEVSNGTNLAAGGAAARLAIEADSPGLSAPIQGYVQRSCPDKSWVLSVFVAMFLHGGWFHIAGNMLFLWVFGNNVEDRLGRVLFAAFYVLGGLAATALQMLIDASSTIPTVGASGAIAAVLGAYLVLFPKARVTTLVFFFFITWIEVPAWVLLLGWFLLQVFSGVGQLSSDLAGGVAYWAHIGGFAFGAATVWLFLRGRRPPTPAFPPRPDYI